MTIPLDTTAPRSPRASRTTEPGVSVHGSTSPTDPETSSVVSCQGLTKRFGDGPVVLDGIDLTVQEDEILVLLGPSGCGKTTLLRCIAGLEHPDSGSVVISGRCVDDVAAGRRGVAMVFQHYALYPHKSAEDNIDFPLRLSGDAMEARRDRIGHLAGLLQIKEMLGRRPGMLSGGQKQRVGIGRALARRPAVLLMDEPLSNLDAKLRTEMRAEILDLRRREGSTIIYVTHDQTEALTLGTRVAVMNGGRIEQIARPEHIYRRPATTFVADFLGSMNLVSLPPTTDGQIGWGGLVHHGVPTAGFLGFRAEAVTAGPAAGDCLELTGTVRLVEVLGPEVLAHILIGETVVRATAPLGSTAIGDTFHGHVAREAIHVFDADGRRIE